MEEPVVKWISNKLLWCATCHKQVRHDVGVSYEGTEEVQVKSCLRCKEVIHVDGSTDRS